jgi:hypothetical protein
MPTQTISPEQRNARRRTQRLTDGRLLRARHAIRTLLAEDASYDGDHLLTTPADITRRTDAMYGSYLKGVPITPEEVAIALEAVLTS